MAAVTLFVCDPARGATYTVSNTNNIGVGSLRQAITDANSNAGADTIAFGIAGAGVHTISPASALPDITDLTMLDATTQPGFSATPIVRLDGASAGGSADGLVLANGSAGSTIRGLMVTRFSHDGIIIQAGASGVTVAGNWLGTNGSGVTAMGNTNTGIEVFGPNATIGGTGVLDRNVIVNNRNEGINVSGGSATGNMILGNFIGLEPDGTSGAGNGDVGIALLPGAAGNTIGGSTRAARNVISMNFEGIEINTANNVISGNYFGTDSSGTENLGQRSSDAVQISGGGVNNRIGGTAPGEGNLIAFTKSGRHGVSIQAGTGNVVAGNSIHSNTGLGIDLGNNGVTANDGAKPAGQPNLLMDFPVFTSAELGGTTLNVAGYVGSAPGQVAFANSVVEVFESDNDGAGFGEGVTYLGTLTSSGSNGNFSGSLDVTGKGLLVGERITGTATDASRNTSEFGSNFTVVAAILAFSVSNSTFAFGQQVANRWTAPQISVITNTGTVAEDVLGRINPFSDSARVWALSALANGVDSVRAQWSTASAAGPWTDVSAYDTDFTIATSVIALDSVTLWFRIQTPTFTSWYRPYSSAFTLTVQ